MSQEFAKKKKSKNYGWITKRSKINNAVNTEPIGVTREEIDKELMKFGIGWPKPRGIIR